MFTFSERIRELREERNMTQAEVAQAVGITMPSYAAYEKGRSPKYDVLRDLANYFDVTIDYLLGNSNARKPKNQALMNSLGLSDKAIETLQEVYKADQANSFTLTINALLEHGKSMYAISKYLFTKLEANDDGSEQFFPYSMVPRYSGAWRSYDNLSTLVDADSTVDFISNKNIKDIQMIEVQNALKELLDIEDGINRLPKYDEGKR